ILNYICPIVIKQILLEQLWVFKCLLDTRNFYIAHVIDSFFSGGSFCLPLY
ncbi:uncharacterized protein METZ01_LOCUS330363, partial [marine metagenome]